LKYSDGPVFEAISTSIPKADAENEEVVDAFREDTVDYTHARFQ